MAWKSMNHLLSRLRFSYHSNQSLVFCTLLIFHFHWCILWVHWNLCLTGIVSDMFVTHVNIPPPVSMFIVLLPNKCSTPGTIKTKSFLTFINVSLLCPDGQLTSYWSSHIGWGEPNTILLAAIIGRTFLPKDITECFAHFGHLWLFDALV